MRRVIYGGAMSLDGYIAGPAGEYDWIVIDPEIDFAALAARFDTYLIGRKTFDMMRGMASEAPATPGIRSIVCSRTLRQSDFPDVTIVPEAEPVVSDLRNRPGKDIALFGGGELFRSLLAAGLVDAVEVHVSPILLGGGVPFLPPPANRAPLRLTEQRVYEKTGTIGLAYDVVRTPATPRRRS